MSQVVLCEHYGYASTVMRISGRAGLPDLRCKIQLARVFCILWKYVALEALNIMKDLSAKVQVGFITNQKGYSSWALLMNPKSKIS